MSYRTGRQRVVSKHLMVVVTDNESPAGTRQLVGKRTTSEPIVEGRLTTIKGIQSVLFIQRLRGEKRQVIVADRDWGLAARRAIRQNG